MDNTVLLSALKCIVLLVFCTAKISAKGERCHTPYDKLGICVALPQCPRLVKFYGQNQHNPAAVEYFFKAQRNCGTRSIRQNSLVCCNDPVFSRPQQPQPFPIEPEQPEEIPPEIVPQTTLHPTTSRTTPATDPIEKTDPSLQGRLLTPEHGCGSSNVTHQKIVGGHPSRRGAFPWMTLIGYRNNFGELSWRCGGSLITTRHVLTAAHCVKPSLSIVRLGEHDIDSKTDGPVQDIKVVRTEKHPNFNKFDGTNDIAVLYLERDVNISARIRPICLPVDEPVRSRDFVGYKPYIAGWGNLQEGGRSSNVLQEVQVPILPNSECKELYRKQGKLISEVQFGDAASCAGELSGGKDSCQGDSGGPLIQPIDNENVGNRYYQIGVVSYGIGCARPNTPAVYARVQHFIDWIQEKVNQ